MPEHAPGAEAEGGTLTGSVAVARAVTGGTCGLEPVQFKKGCFGLIPENVSWHELLKGVVYLLSRLVWQQDSEDYRTSQICLSCLRSLP